MTGHGTDARAQAIMTRHARSFAPAARLLARADRARVARLYALCRTIDDLADEDGSAAAGHRLAALRDALRAKGLCDPIADDVRGLFAGREAGVAAFADLVAGVCSDLGPVEVETVAALDVYAQSVAGTVGVMMAVLFDVPAMAHGPAADLGRAMQLTNICRDVAEDAAAGRRYLPATLCPWTPAQIAAPTAQVRTDVKRAVQVILQRADVLYASGFRGLAVLPPRVRLCVAVAAALYRGIGDVLRGRDCDALQGRVHVSGPRKLRLAALAGAGLIRSPGAGWVATVREKSRA